MESNTSASFDVNTWIVAAGASQVVAAFLTAREIDSDARYLVVRSGLSSEIRDPLDLFRFKFIAKRSADVVLPVEVFQAAPAQFRGEACSSLRLTVRARNCLNIAGLETIGAISDLGTVGLLGIRNCGRKTVHEISDAIKEGAREWLWRRSTGDVSGTILVPASWQRAASEAVREDAPSESEAASSPGVVQGRSLESGLGIDSPQSESQGRIRTLAEGIALSFSELNERSKFVVEKRLGMLGSVPTLQELGLSLSLTRERVRQIESKSISLILSRGGWPESLVKSLTRLLALRSEPLWLAWLAVEDPFFGGFSFGESALGKVIEVFTGGEFCSFDLDGVPVCSRIGKDEFDALRIRSLEIVRDLLPSRPTKTHVSVLVESLASNAGARELHGRLFESILPVCHFAQLPGRDDEVLVAFGRGADHVVREVLEEADHPLHYSEVHRRVKERANSDVDIRRVHNGLAQTGVFLFGRGTYGVARHFSMSEERAAEVLEAAEDLILGGDPDRQWHAREILERLPFDTAGHGDEITPYDLNFILARSKDLRYLGRMIWVAQGSSHRDSADRIDVAQACARFLREAGRPLHMTEIRKLLLDWRGVGTHFQLNAGGDLIALAPGLWGLRERDLPLPLSKCMQILDSLYARLKLTEAGVHQSEIVNTLRDSGLSVPPNMGTYWVMSLAGSDSRMRVFYGGYVGLSSWPDPRRLTASAAGREMARVLSVPLPLADLSARISDLVGRPIGRPETASVCRDAGFAFDQDADCWVPPTDGGDE